MKFHFITAVMLLIFSAPLSAQEFAYVTDSLQLRVYASASASSEVLQSIDSGDSVEVFATENGFSKVSTYDGTEGWVKSAFLVLDPPAKLLYYSVGEKNKELVAEIEVLKSGAQTSTTSSNEADTNKINELQTALANEQEINQKLQEQIADTADIQAISTVSFLTTTQTEIRPQSYFDNKKWLLLGLPLAFIVAGLLLGIKISSWRMRKRLHGFRI